MRKLVIIVIAFFAVVTFIRAFADVPNDTVPAAVELNETSNG